ncbi:MAG: acyl-CoA dehydrogenase family protein, partial [bacterium]|nr:acyl-CoA dehydrogenase family protein [bacterium]
MIPETEEHRLIRESIAQIASPFGHEYFSEKVRSGQRSTELWNAVAEAGFVGVNIPEAYGGGGMGIIELCVVIEERARNGCPLLMLIVSPAICGS